MKKYEEYADNHDGDPPFKMAAKYLGLQSVNDDYKIWVLNKSLQVGQDREELQISTSPYAWLGDFSVKCKGLSSYSIVAAKVSGSLSRKIALRKLVKQLKVTYENNYPAAIITLGAQIMSVHYESLFEAGFNVPATLLHGEISHGKSIATKAALSMLGIQDTHFLTGISDSKVLQVTSATTLGLVIDDPSDIKEISEKIMFFYDKGIKATCGNTISPRSTYMSSINRELLLKLTSLPNR